MVELVNNAILRLSTMILFLCTLVSIGACKKEKQPILPADQSAILKDVSYGSNALQKMDVYLPANRSNSTNLIIYVHGGGWYQGDKAEIKDGATYFQQQGIAFISLNYRLTRTPDNNIHPAQVEDIGKAIDLVIANQTTWTITNSRITLFGGSAGGHLSLLYAYKYNTGNRVKTVISVAGPTDLTDDGLINNSIGGFSVGAMIESFIGEKITDNVKAWQDASPINYISSTSTPTYFIHGTADSAVPYDQSVTAFNKLTNVGGVAKLETLDNVGHDLVGLNWADVIPKMIDFINVNTP